MPPSALPLGSVLPGELELEEKLSGRVYRARRARDGRELAVRIVYPTSASMASDFLALAEAASRIRHPTLASVEGFGRLTDNGCYIATEFVHGQRLDAWADGVGIPPLAQVVELMRRLCLGLQTALRAGVVHDALNPRNIRILGHAHASANDTGIRTPMKLLDLGVIALCKDNADDPHALRFMAPEQLVLFARLDRPDAFRCSATMNVYSCGGLLYLLTTGGPPFPGNSASELMGSQAGGRLVPPMRINPQIPAALNAVIVRALSLDPSERFESVSQLGEALATVSNQALASLRPSLPAPAPREPALALGAEDDPLLDGPPTFKAERPGALLLMQESDNDNMVQPSAATTDRHEMPTLPPPSDDPSATRPPPSAADADDGVSGVAPIGLFSSSPPYDRTSSSVIELVGTTSSHPPSRFSEPVPPGTTIIVVNEGKAIVPRTLTPIPFGVVARRRGAALSWLIPVALAACVVAFFTVRAFTIVPASPTPAGPEQPTEPVRTASAERTPERTLTPAAEPAAAPSQPDSLAGAVSAEQAGLHASRDTNHESWGRDRNTGRSRDHGQRGRNQAHSSPSAEAAEPPDPDALRDAAASAHNTGNEAAAAGETGDPRAKPAPSSTPSGGEAEAAKLPVEVTRVPSPTRTVPQPLSPGLPFSASVQIDGFSVRGSLPTSQVRRSVERIRASFANCYKQAAQAAGHHGFGELIVDVRIDERGRANAPRVHGGQLPRLDACVADAVSKLICEKAPDTGTVLASWKITYTP